MINQLFISQNRNQSQKVIPKLIGSNISITSYLTYSCRSQVEVGLLVGSDPLYQTAKSNNRLTKIAIASNNEIEWGGVSSSMGNLIEFKQNSQEGIELSPLTPYLYGIYIHNKNAESVTGNHYIPLCSYPYEDQSPVGVTNMGRIVLRNPKGQEYYNDLVLGDESTPKLSDQMITSEEGSLYVCLTDNARQGTATDISSYGEIEIQGKIRTQALLTLEIPHDTTKNKYPFSSLSKYDGEELDFSLINLYFNGSTITDANAQLFGAASRGQFWYNIDVIWDYWSSVDETWNFRNHCNYRLVYGSTSEGLRNTEQTARYSMVAELCPIVVNGINTYDIGNCILTCGPNGMSGDSANQIDNKPVVRLIFLYNENYIEINYVTLGEKTSGAIWDYNTSDKVMTELNQTGGQTLLISQYEENGGEPYFRVNTRAIENTLRYPKGGEGIINTQFRTVVRDNVAETVKYVPVYRWRYGYYQNYFFISIFPYAPFGSSLIDNDQLFSPNPYYTSYSEGSSLEVLVGEDFLGSPDIIYHPDYNNQYMGSGTPSFVFKDEPTEETFNPSIPVDNS